jgi:glycosyltransferase involved in cell wall biosynthesis
MKVLMQQSAYYPWIGGAEIFMQKVAEHLVSEGHQVDIVTGLWDKPDVYTQKWNHPHEMMNGVNVYRTPTFGMRYVKTVSCIPGIVRKSRGLDRRNGYDIVHGHIFPGMITAALSKGKKKLLLTAQGGDLADYEERGAFIDRLKKPAISWALRKADMVHAVSNHIARRATELGARNVTVVPNGVDVSLFKPLDKAELRTKYGFGMEEKIVVSSSRLTPKNGIDDLIRAAAMLNDTKLLLLGGGEEKENLQKLINELGCAERIKLLGYVENKKLPEYMNIADVFCRPSRSEGFGISFIEAMACKTPVVGTPAGGIPDIIEDGRNGLMAEPNNPKMLAEALKKLLDDEAYARTLGAEGYRTVQEKFTWETVLSKMDDVYAKLMEGS